MLVIAGGVAARSGVIIKGVDALERGHKATDIIFDKTGTLTLDDLSVVEEHVYPSTSIPKEEVMSLAKTLVTGNNHPVSNAVSRHLGTHCAPEIKLESVESVPGSGIQAIYQGHPLRAGNPHWLNATDDPNVSSILSLGHTAFCLTLDSNLLITYSLRSTLRPEATAVITSLRNHNLRCHILSGDHEHAVHSIARAVGIETANTRARCSPAQKKDYVQALQDEGRTVLFCGDGTNDAVAIAQANVGMQIGSASDVTKGVSDVTLLRGLEGIEAFLDVSKRSFRRIAFNFVWSAVYNVFAILLASGAMVRVRIPPAYAGLGEVVSVAPVVLAAMSLLWLKRW